MPSEDLPTAHENMKNEFRQRFNVLIKWCCGFALFFFVIPGLFILALPESQRIGGLATLAAVPAIEFLAISVGIGLGVDPIIAFIITVLSCTGLCILVLGILGFIGDSSSKAKRFLEGTQKRIDKYSRLKKYGVASNFLFVMFLGVYIVPGISIILGWPRAQSVVFMAGGIALITVLIGLGTMGILDLFFL